MCRGSMEWGEVMRSCFGRKAWVEREEEQARKQARKELKKAAKRAGKAYTADEEGSILSTTDDEDAETPSRSFLDAHVPSSHISALVSPPERIGVEAETRIRCQPVDGFAAEEPKGEFVRRSQVLVVGAKATPKRHRSSPGKTTQQRPRKGVKLLNSRGGPLGADDAADGSGSEMEWERLERKLMAL